MTTVKHLTVLLGIAAMLFSCNGTTVRKQGYEVHGIDLSHYQRRVDWEKIASQDIHFTFIKATEGETYRDSFFCQNWEEAKLAGIRRGAYHFFRPTLSPEKQAKNFIDFAELMHGDLAPVLDIEVTDGVETNILVAHIRSWLHIVEDQYKVKPILYTNQKFFNDHLAGHFEDYPIWIARYSSWRMPSLHKNRQWSFWQYGNNGRLQGIEGPVDLNVFDGNLSDLESLCLIRPEPLFVPEPAELVLTAP